MSEITKIFKLFACNIPVKGAKRSIICDLQRNEFHFIPNILFFILTNLRDKNIPEIKEYYENKNDLFIDEYFDFLVSNELGFFTDIPESYPEIDLRWEKPSTITNAIIDIDINSNHSFDKLRNQLDNLGCKALQLRFYDSLGFSQLFEVLDIFNESRLESIDIIYPFGTETIEEEIKRIVSKYQRISFFVVHSSPEDQIINHEKLKTNILYLKKAITSESHCGVISPLNFYVNIDLFSESQLFNSCLNRKISIDKNGNIKNCPSMKETFGNIKSSNLSDALKIDTFKQYWSITKDQIDICQDCEFRYICTDCMAFKSGGKYSKPLKCTYNPYTATWKHPDDNPDNKFTKFTKTKR